MSNCQCPPVASRGLFKYLTYLIPIRQCSQHRGPGIVYRGIIKLQEGAILLQYYISSIPVASIAGYLPSVEIGNMILKAIMEKCNFFLSIIKPPLEKLVAYINSYYSTEGSGEKTVSESFSKASKSLPKPAETDTFSFKSFGSAKTVSSAVSGGSVKSSTSKKTAVSEPSTAIEKPTVSEKSAGSATSSDIKIELKSGQVKVLEVSQKPLTAEPPVEKPPNEAKGLKYRTNQLLSGILRAFQYVFNLLLSSIQYMFNGIISSVHQVFNAIISSVQYVFSTTISSVQYVFNTLISSVQYVFNALISTAQYVFNVIMNTVQYVSKAVLRPIQYASSGMSDVAIRTKDRVVSAGHCTYDYLSNCPLWVYMYLLFVTFIVAYIAYQTYITYKGRMWARANKIPARL